MKNFTVLAIFFLLFTGLNITYAQEWVQIYSDPGNRIAQANSIAVDDSGNVYVTGYGYGPSSNYYDYITIKYNSSGVQKWIRYYNGLGNNIDQANSIAVDGSGNVYVTGSSTGNGTDKDYATLKYNTSGVLQWIKRYNGPGNSDDQAKVLVVDDSGNVYVTGSSTGNGTDKDYATIKYNSNGDSKWVQRYNGPANIWDAARSIAVDDIGNVYVTGESYVNGNNNDYATIKYNSNGDSLWVKRYGGPANSVDYATSLGLDDSGNVYVTGVSNFEGTYSDYGTIKYNSNGDLIWLKRYSGPESSNDIAISLKVDNSGNVYVTGTSYADIVTIKYNSNGDSLWVQNYNGTANNADYVTSLALDDSGNVYITGYSYRGNNLTDIATVKYKSNPPSVYFNLTLLVEGFYDDVSNSMVTDTVRVYLRSNTPPFLMIDSSKAVLTSNGNYFFSNALNSTQYYIVIKHRNSNETWSKNAEMVISNQLNYDFTISSNKAFGDNLILKGSKYCIYSGDVNQDGSIDITDVILVYNSANNNGLGYIKTDLNGDYFVDATDLLIAYNNSINIISVIRP